MTCLLLLRNLELVGDGLEGCVTRLLWSIYFKYKYTNTVYPFRDGVHYLLNVQVRNALVGGVDLCASFLFYSHHISQGMDVCQMIVRAFFFPLSLFWLFGRVPLQSSRLPCNILHHSVFKNIGDLPLRE